MSKEFFDGDAYLKQHPKKEDQQVFFRSFLDVMGYKETDKEFDFNEEPDIYDMSSSQWLTKMMVYKNSNFNGNVCIVFFGGPDHIRKNYFWGPWTFGEITDQEVEEFATAFSSFGAHYYHEWSFGKKGIRISKLTLSSFLKDSEEVMEKVKLDKDARKIGKAEKEHDAIKWLDNLIGKAEEEQAQIDAGGKNLGNLFLVGIRDIEFLFEFSIKGRIKWLIVNSLNVPFNPSTFKQLQFQFKQLDTMLKTKNIASMKPFFSRFTNAYNPFLKQSRAVYKGKEAIKDLRKTIRSSKKHIARSFVRDNANELVELKKGFETHKLGDKVRKKTTYEVMGKPNIKNLQGSKMYAWKSEVENMKKNNFISGKKFYQTDLNKYNKWKETTDFKKELKLMKTGAGNPAKRTFKNGIKFYFAAGGSARPVRPSITMPTRRGKRRGRRRSRRRANRK